MVVLWVGARRMQRLAAAKIRRGAEQCTNSHHYELEREEEKHGPEH